jgi:hypothetical protein
MIDRNSIDQGAFRVIGGEALPNLTNAAPLFSNLPAGCRAVLISVYSGDFNLRLDGVNPTATTGQRFGVTPAPVMLGFSRDTLAQARAIGTATGWITYLATA